MARVDTARFKFIYDTRLECFLDVVECSVLLQEMCAVLQVFFCDLLITDLLLSTAAILF